MGFGHLKRWQWAVLGLLLGLAMGFLQSSFSSDGFTFGGQHRSLGQEAFERAIVHPAVDGRPEVKDVRVSADGGKLLVQFSYLPFGDEKNRLKNGYEKSLLTTDIPFQPVADLSKTVNVGIHPAMAHRSGTKLGVVKVNMWPRPVHAEFSGWKVLDNDSADPGADGQVHLTLRPAAYTLTLMSPGATAAQVAHLTLKLNDRLLPSLQPGAQVGGQPLWQTKIPHDAFVKADLQVLHVSRGDEPIPVREIRLMDPTYTVVDYLRELSVAHPQIAYHAGWQTKPEALLLFWALGSVALVGGVLPTVATALGAGPPEDSPEETRAKSAATDAEMIESDSASAPATLAIDDEVDRALATTVDSQVLESVPMAMGSGSEPDPKNFEGTYYPVRRPKSEGFSLAELLVVIGIIALLLGLLMPALARSRQEAQRVQCMSNMRQVGLSLLSYANHWRGAMFPPLLGDSQPVTNRWPVYVFDPPVYNPPEMTCPVDEQPVDEHTYLLNNHLPEHNVTYSNTQMSSVTPSDVIVMGEKVTSVADYYMDSVPGDYTNKVDFYKHGPLIGSNYLYLDLHVETDMPMQSTSDVDPWDPTAVTVPPPSTNPSQ